MTAYCILSCKSMKQEQTLTLSESIQDLSEVDFSSCTSVYEDGSYELHFHCPDILKSDVHSVQACVNGEPIGFVMLDAFAPDLMGSIRYRDSVPTHQPFLLHYDLITLSFIVTYAEGSSVEFFSECLLCVSRNVEDSQNVQQMLQELLAFDHAQVNELIFANADQASSHSLFEGSWNHRAYKSLNSYLQLLDQIITTYRTHFAFFKLQGKHTLKRSSVLVSYEKVNVLSQKSFNWIMQNANQLAQVGTHQGFQHQGKYYLPYQIQSEVSKKSWDLYENQILVSFLHKICFNAKQIVSDFHHDLHQEELKLSQLKTHFTEEYHASIATIKSLQITLSKILLEKIRLDIKNLQQLAQQYQDLFCVSPQPLTALPRKTRTFCEIKPYAQIFQMITRSFQYGDLSLEKERHILRAKNLDKIFEYYCLHLLLKVLIDHGFQTADRPGAIHHFQYHTASFHHHPVDDEIPNTFHLQRGSLQATLYYQPNISALSFENELTLFRTTLPSSRALPPYYTPDFVLKFSSDSATHDEEYIILDAKFSSHGNILEHSLPDVMRKYGIECAAAAHERSPKMVWILQGRTSNTPQTIWHYHRSPIIKKFAPTTSYGILNVNTSQKTQLQLWGEMKRNIALLSTQQIFESAPTALPS